MFKKKEITRRDYDDDVRQAMIQAQKQSDDPVEQFLWLKNNDDLNPKQKIINMVDLIQANFNVHMNKEMSLYDGYIDMLMRSIGDALSDMQEDLPGGVYNYIKKNAENTLEEIIKQGNNERN